MDYDELILNGNMLNFEQLKEECFKNPPRHPQFKHMIPMIEECDDIGTKNGIVLVLVCISSRGF